MTVLIVDDHPGFRAWAAAVLRGDGYDVIGEAHDGDSALERADALRPDIVLLDVQLPGLDGFEIARRLQTPVVLISTRDATDYGPAIDGCGARGFIAKDDLSGAALEAVLA